MNATSKPTAHTPIYWERRGAAIYEETPNDEPGAARLIAELHPASVASVQTIVDNHNADVARAEGK